MRIYAQTPGATTSYTHWSPKLGATLALSTASSLYAAYSHGFRAPSESQLFRAGSGSAALEAGTKAELALALKPVKADQLEVGWRGQAGGWAYDLALYQLVKRDDLVTQRDLASNVSTSVNAGQTEHQGVELALGKVFNPRWRLDTALSYAVHRYVDWVTATANYSGKEMEAAPRVIANTRLGWQPQADTSVQLEWVRLGDYWLEASNSDSYGKYPGHDVFNLRFQRLRARDPPRGGSEVAQYHALRGAAGPAGARAVLTRPATCRRAPGLAGVTRCRPTR